MNHFQQKQTGFRGDYKNCNGICEMSANDMKQLYLLAFLLTANHQKAEQCFLRAFEEFPNNPTTFGEMFQAWMRRTLIQGAVHNVFPQLRHGDQKRDRWWVEHGDADIALINPVTKLAPLERFVFVMSVLEGYSMQECSVMLECTLPMVAAAKTCALAELAAFQPVLLEKMTEAACYHGAMA
ncbi:MAG TPA: hypothetical protein VKT33_04745 [Candidatus Angelobacter sp.]|nr:hypothetical protein [Candidatus Angelobacter sp.]